MNCSLIIFLKEGDSMFCIKILTIGAVFPIDPLSSKKTAPLPACGCDGIPVGSKISLECIKIGKLKKLFSGSKPDDFP